MNLPTLTGFSDYLASGDSFGVVGHCIDYCQVGVGYADAAVLFYRPYWRCYYSNTDAIIYVVDSMDKDRIGISKQELIAMLEVTS